MLSRLLLFLLLLFPIAARPQEAFPVIRSENTFHQTFEKAVFALYEHVPTGDEDKPFHARFTCTATAVAKQDDSYILLTAGHCVDGSKNKFYVAEAVSDNPVLQSVTIVKHALTDRYDYAILLLQSHREYPVIPVSLGPTPPIETPIINVNFSYGLTKQTTHGTINSALMSREEASGGVHCGPNCAGKFLGSIGIAPGASGSAVVDENTHQIIGITKGYFPGAQTIGAVIIPTGQNFDDFTVDDGVSEDAPPAKAVEKPEPILSQENIAYNKREISKALMSLGLLILLLTFFLNFDKIRK